MISGGAFAFLSVSRSDQFQNTDKLRIIHFTLITPHQPSLLTPIYLATLSQTYHNPNELQPTPSAFRRKAGEAFLIHRGETLSPDGVNRRNEH